MLEWLFHNVVQVSIATSIVIVAMFLLQPLMNKNFTPKWRYIVWLIIGIRLLIPLSPTVEKAPVTIPSVSQNIEINVPVANNTDINSQRDITPIHSEPIAEVANTPVEHTVTLAEVLPIIWIIGTLLFLAYYIIGYLVFKKNVLRFSDEVSDEGTLNIWKDIKQQMKVKSRIKLIKSKKVQSPMMIGFIKPMLVMPSTEYSEEDIALIMEHELIHYKHKDIWSKLLVISANAVHWFNPLVYIMRGRLNADIEMACDSEVVEGKDKEFRKQYGETILSAIHKGKESGTVLSTYFYGGMKAMRERLGNIFDMRGKRKGIIALCVVIIAVLVVGSIVTYGSNQPKPITAEEKTEITTLLNNFADTFTKVVLIDPEDQVISEIKQYYSPYLTDNLLAKWEFDPSEALGRVTSSPWPDQIEIISMDKLDGQTVKVKGYILWVSSGGVGKLEIDDKVPAQFIVKKDPATQKFLIDEAYSNSYALYDTKELTKTLRTAFPSAGSESEPVVSEFLPLGTATGQGVALVDMGTGGAYTEYYTACFVSVNKLQLAKFKNSDGTIENKFFDKGTSTKHEANVFLQMSEENNNKNFALYYYNADRDDNGKVTAVSAEVYDWSGQENIFEYDATASEKFKEQLENTLNVDNVVLAQLYNMLYGTLLDNYSDYYKDITIKLSLDERDGAFTEDGNTVSAIFNAEITATLKAEKVEDMPFVKGMLDYLDTVKPTLTASQLKAANGLIDDWQSELSGYIGKPEPTSYATYKITAQLDKNRNVDEDTVKLFSENEGRFYSLPNPMFNSDETQYKNGQNAMKEAIEKAK
jgi:beta-lactamase regulating signal transducer with metallopeptidase domain